MILVNDRYLVLTPEKVVIRYDLVGIGPRALAHFIDLLLLIFATIAVSIGVGFLGALSAGLASFVSSLVTAFAFFIYFIAFEGAAGGQTPGKRALGIRVIHADGTPLTWRGAIIRNVIRVGDLLPPPYLAGFLTMFLNERSQRLGDLFANTVVCRVSEAQQGFTPAPHRAGVHQLESLVPELDRMTLAEYFAIKRLCDRWPYLPPEEQVRSMQDIWEPFRKEHKIENVSGVHPIYIMEAVVMKYGRLKKLV